MEFPEPLNTLSEVELVVIERFVETLRFPAETMLFRVNDPTDGCYIIDKGLVRIELDREGSNPDNHDDVFAFIEPGTILGELSLLDRLPRSASAIAHTDVVARRISVEALDELTRTFPHIALTLVMALGKSAAGKLRQTNQRLDNVIGAKYDPEVEEMLDRAEVAQREIRTWSEDRIDALLLAMAQAFAAQAEHLARAAVEETGMGNVADKTIKNTVASMGVYESLVGRAGYGRIDTDEARHVVNIASPVGIVFGLVPVTNPTSTFIFKALICLKARNAVILSPNRRAQGVSDMVGKLIQDVLRAHGAPVDAVQWVQSRSTRKTTITFMGHKKVGLILATGGPAMVKAAYSSGNPAIGVGSGNAPALICADADLKHAAWSVVTSKSFDNGLICGSEHNLVVDQAIREPFIAELEAAGAAVLSDAEFEQLVAVAVDPMKRIFTEAVIGQSAEQIAAQAGITRAHSIRVIVAPRPEVSDKEPFSGEKMTPILSLYTVKDLEAGFDTCKRLLAIDGSGHTAIIHTRDEATIQKFGMLMPASRILANSPGAHGVVGISTGLVPSLTLGCGTFGHTSTTDNVTYSHLMNVKRLAYFTPERLARVYEHADTLPAIE